MNRGGMLLTHRIEGYPKDYNRIPDAPLRTTGKKMSLTSRHTAPHMLPPSPADSVDHRNSPSPLSMEQDRIMNGISRGAPGDQAIFSGNKSPEQRQLNKKKSQYYGDAFAYREPISSARERVTRESLIIADIRTNVIIQDEYTFITDLSYILSSRYQRPESSILVTVAHSACLFFSGSFDPAYTMTINALPSQLQPVTNKRNASLLQKSMEELLSVLPERGVVKFIPIAEDNLATNGKTVTGEIEDLEREISMGDGSIARSLSRGANKSRKKLSMRSMRNLKSGNVLETHEERIAAPIPEEPSSQLPPPPMPVGKSTLDREAEKVQKMGRRKSFMAAVFGKS